MNCAACRRDVRSTRTAIVREGIWRRRRVCKDCADRGVLIVAATSSPCKCGAPATTCTPCANERTPKDRTTVVRGAVRKLRALANAYEKPIHGDTNEASRFALSLAGGLRQAADILEGGDW